jgi:hypothetical protein
MFNPMQARGRMGTFFFTTLVILTQSLSAQVSISSFTPASGPIGSTVTITGTNFNSSDIVYFGAVKALVTAASSTSLTVTVPAGASYQPITVTAQGLTAYSSKPFLVTFSGGTGPGVFPANSFSGITYLANNNGPGPTVAADIDGDGKPDLITANSGKKGISVYRNTAANYVMSFAANVDFSSLATVGCITAADIDGDGKIDVIVGTSNGISVFLNTSSAGTISFATRIDIAGPPRVKHSGCRRG